MPKIVRFIAMLCLASAAGGLCQEPQPAIAAIQQNAEAVLLRIGSGSLRIEPCGEGIARVTYFTGSQAPDLSNPVIPGNVCTATQFSLRRTEKDIAVEWGKLKVSVDRLHGAVSFADSDGHLLLAESQRPLPRSLAAASMNGEPVQRASTWFALTPEERLYGLGQHQHGLLNERNLEMQLSQDNTNISIPFFLSSKGYGVFWNNTSSTRWNNRFQPVLAVESEVASAVDYFFIAGPEFDTIIAGYRHLTGQASLLPRWAYGYWQSKDSYYSQAELLDAARTYRRLQIPVDNMVLDAVWETRLGSRVFSSKYPDPAGMVRELHGEHMHLMVSTWPLFEQGSATYDELLQQDDFVVMGDYKLPPGVPGGRLYDPFKPAARQLYWDQIQRSLASLGVDAYWLDSTEPGDFFNEEHGSMLAGAQTGMGNGSRYQNLYPFMATKALYDGQRSVTSRKRVFLLSRSAFAGMQRNGAAAWSGDTASNFQTLKRQIPAGLNYSLTGLPYWTTDIGGYLGGDPSDPAYREVFVRWFQYGAFCPIFRVHGNRVGNQNELWSYGPQAQTILTLYDRLRYRMLPYIYSIAARTTFAGYTPMRALPFDFRHDPRVLDINDEFLFGPSFLVAPVTDAGAVSRSVYLPAGADWYDFWTGERLRGGQQVTRATPLPIMPLYVRSGSIVPLDGEQQYSDQNPSQRITLRIYAGADADFDLYDDDGTTYGYEKGESARIPIHWDDKARTLTIGTRQGSFPDMVTERSFALLLVRPGHGTGEAVAAADRVVRYDGSAKKIRF